MWAGRVVAPAGDGADWPIRSAGVVLSLALFTAWMRADKVGTFFQRLHLHLRISSLQLLFGPLDVQLKLCGCCALHSDSSVIYTAIKKWTATRIRAHARRTAQRHLGAFFSVSVITRLCE